MPLTSMTGFARSDGAHGPVRWHWELKSVNGRGLDIRCRLPQGHDPLEQEVRKTVSAGLSRGNCQIGLTMSREQEAGALRINHDVLSKVVEVANSLKDEIDAAPPTLDGLLAIKGVVELAEAEETDAERAELHAAILTNLREAVGALVTMRESEGAKMQSLLEGQINDIERLTNAARKSTARSPEAIKVRLAAQVEKLLEASSTLDPDRLHQEALLLAAKADIQEELDRLDAHIAAARELFASDGPAGRKLDFLTQEFNREANTLCSKSNDADVTTIGLEMKALIDQMKEQVQNIE